MDIAAPNSLPALGFLTVVEDDQHGYFGGYLLLSELGRPLEFHCSTPVFPSRAQKILYGSTLRSYVLGELIGQTLVNRAQLPVHAVLTDLEEMLSLGLVWQGVLAWMAPVKRVRGDADFQSQEAGQPREMADSHEAAQPREASPSHEGAPSRAAAWSPQSGSPKLNLGDYCLMGSSTCCWSPEKLSEALTPLASYVDLGEPFQRIREAIQEAQRVTEQPVEEDDENSAAA